MPGGRSSGDPVCPYSKTKDAFFVFDANADGKVPGPDATVAARSCGVTFQGGVVPDLFTQPEITFEAFEKFVTAELTGKKPHEDLHKAFEALDSKNTGRISTCELKEILQVCGTLLDKESIDELIKTADKDNTGWVDYNQFAAFLLK